MRTPSIHANRSGFTLIELLIVITIIAILASVSVPIFGMVKESANASRSKSGLRSIGDALNAFQGDNDGKYPAIEGANPQIEGLDNWVSELVVAINTNSTIEELNRDPNTKIFVSPGVGWQSGTGGYLKSEQIYNTYATTDGLVGYDLDDNPDPTRGRHISRMERRSETLLLVEAQQEGNRPYCRPWITWAEASSDLANGSKRAQIVDYRYKNKLNALMADNSVKSFSDEEGRELKEWNWVGEDYPANSR